MIRHILIVAWRNICKYKVSAGIAVVGLAMGLLCFVLCNFCARLFFSIDKVFPNYDRMAEIQIKVGEGEELQDYFAGTPPTLAASLPNCSAAANVLLFRCQARRARQDHRL